MSQYEGFSQYYDELTQDQSYDQWLDIIHKATPKRDSILDIGCGTGSLTTILTDFKSVTGMDISSDMLAVASKKSDSVRWIEGDMTEFELNQNFDVITILCDSLNYITDQSGVIKTFKHVYRHLNADGTFIFDVHSVFKMNTLFANQNYIDETEHIFLAWEAIQGDLPNSVWHYMTFFECQDDGKYRRFDEEHYQRTFSEQEYTDMLKEVGFNHINTFYDFDTANHDEQSDRLFFIVKK
ncbi:class I SAM-dependent DNA methyltransferase [Staphylococcus simulans]|uniref:class I SAM-dependent DNA methyltransferase n=1 Tax=Staphylococcus simulans TaxID=1286 RepID=UPI000D1FCB96|nr:class I SAM-dependent methyltransferase [Staphylococcus simulans]MDY5060687.1 class I SAM-dependent methyltransferase [Staphylococcus simulans]PTJ17363.1 SAM-dependent methyltransferase [Staphylococcus simulans]